MYTEFPGWGGGGGGAIPGKQCTDAVIKKTMRKGTFFSRRAVRSADII